MIALALLLTAVFVAAGLWAKNVAAKADTGAEQVRSGAKRLSAMDATAAASDFAAAKASFNSVTQSLGPPWISAAVGAIPWVGRQYVATQTLALIGSDGSLAGLELAEALQTPSTTSTADPANRLGSALPARLAHVEAAFASLSSALDRADTLSPDGLLPPLAQRGKNHPGHQGEDRALGGPESRAARARSPISSPATAESSWCLRTAAELRPTGGWAGSFGIVNTGPSGVQLESYQDVFVLPNPRVRVAMPQGALQSKNFNFRNANWWIDFPTSAQRMLAFWLEAKQAPVDGIVVIDPVVMADLLEVVGPITVPFHKETFTSENLLERMLYLTQTLKGGQPDRKNVLVELATELEKRVVEAESGRPGEVGTGPQRSRRCQARPDVLHRSRRAGLSRLAWLVWPGRPSRRDDGRGRRLQRDEQAGQGQHRDEKVDRLLRPAPAGPLGRYNARAGLREHRPLPDRIRTGTVFRDWLRVYRIPGTVFPRSTPSGSKTTTLTDFGFPAEARLFSVLRGQTRTETLTARVPDAVRIGTGKPPADKTALYQLYMVRQADLEDIPTTVTVTAAPGWRVSSASARLVASGASLPVKTEDDRASMAIPLSGDLVLKVTLAPN